MDGFRVDCGKLNVQCDTLENYEILMKEMKENINSVCTGLRHKLSAMDDIGSNLKKIEENLQSETVIMANMRGTLTTVISNYRKAEGTITGFKAGIVSEKTGTTQSEEMKPLGKGAGVSFDEERMFGNYLYAEVKTEPLDGWIQPTEDTKKHRFDEPAWVVDTDGYRIGYCDEDGYVTVDGLEIGGRVDEHGIYHDENGMPRGKREDSNLDICGPIIDMGGHRQYLKEKAENMKITKNSDYMFVEWKRYQDGVKLAFSDSLCSWGVPKVISDRISDGMISYFSMESICEATHDMIVHGDIEKGASAWAHKVIGTVLPQYSIGKTVANQLEVLVKDLLIDFAESEKNKK